MLTRFLAAVFCAGIFLSLMIEATIHIGLVTDGEKQSSTRHYVTFRVHGEKGTTDWMYPKAKGIDFTRGRQMKTEFKDQKSVGKMETIDIRVEKYRIWLGIPDRWKGYKVLISDKDTKETYSVQPPGWITDEMTTLPLKRTSCVNTAKECKCHTNVSTWSNEAAFKVSKFEIDECPQACGYCYKA